MSVVKILLPLLFAVPLFAQTPPTDSTAKVAFSPAKVVVKGSVSSLVTIPPGVQVGVEYFVSPRVSLYTEGGYLFRYNFIWGSETTFNLGKLKGARVREEVRWYFDKLPGRSAGTNEAFFAAAEIFYKYTDTRRQEWVERFSGSFQQEITLRRIQNVLGGHLKVGVQGFFPSGFCYEFSAGFGLKYNHYTFDGLPPDARLTDQDNTEWLSPIDFQPDRWNLAPSAYVGFKLGYCF